MIFLFFFLRQTNIASTTAMLDKVQFYERNLSNDYQVFVKDARFETITLPLTNFDAPLENPLYTSGNFLVIIFSKL